MNGEEAGALRLPFFFQAEDGIRDGTVTGVQTCALPICRLLGLEQKMKQYAEGRIFVGGVVDLVGMEGFNRVWEGPQNLPLLEELTAPARWVERVLRSEERRVGKECRSRWWRDP